MTFYRQRLNLHWIALKFKKFWWRHVQPPPRSERHDFGEIRVFIKKTANKSQMMSECLLNLETHGFDFFIRTRIDTDTWDRESQDLKILGPITTIWTRLLFTLLTCCNQGLLGCLIYLDDLKKLMLQKITFLCLLISWASPFPWVYMTVRFEVILSWGDICVHIDHNYSREVGTYLIIAGLFWR